MVQVESIDAELGLAASEDARLDSLLEKAESEIISGESSRTFLIGAMAPIVAKICRNSGLMQQVTPYALYDSVTLFQILNLSWSVSYRIYSLISKSLIVCTQYPRLRVSAMLALCKLMAIDADFWYVLYFPLDIPQSRPTLIRWIWYLSRSFCEDVQFHSYDLNLTPSRRLPCDTSHADLFCWLNLCVQSALVFLKLIYTCLICWVMTYKNSNQFKWSYQTWLVLMLQWPELATALHSGPKFRRGSSALKLYHCPGRSGFSISKRAGAVDWAHVCSPQWQGQKSSKECSTRVDSSHPQRYGQGTSFIFHFADCKHHLHSLNI